MHLSAVLFVCVAVAALQMRIDRSGSGRRTWRDRPPLGSRRSGAARRAFASVSMHGATRTICMTPTVRCVCAHSLTPCALVRLSRCLTRISSVSCLAGLASTAAASLRTFKHSTRTTPAQHQHTCELDETHANGIVATPIAVAHCDADDCCVSLCAGRVLSRVCRQWLCSSWPSGHKHARSQLQTACHLTRRHCSHSIPSICAVRVRMLPPRSRHG